MKRTIIIIKAVVAIVEVLATLLILNLAFRRLDAPSDFGVLEALALIIFIGLFWVLRYRSYKNGALRRKMDNLYSGIKSPWVDVNTKEKKNEEEKAATRAATRNRGSGLY